MASSNSAKRPRKLAEVPIPEGALPSIERLRRDIRNSASGLSESQARFLVDDYYAMQDFRIQLDAQLRAAEEAGEPFAVTAWLGDQMRALEGEVKKALGTYAESKRVGRWALSQHGVGPVITAGLLAHIDIKKAPTAGHIWSFAGLNPTVKWEKGQKRPWNAKLKRLCWNIGECFKKTSGSDKAFYGKIYRERKDQEESKSKALAFQDQAIASLARIKDPKTRAIYETGQLPPGRLDLRAMRYAVKMFLSHWHHVAFVCEYGELPPKPFVIAHLGHVHVIEPPGWPCE